MGDRRESAALEITAFGCLSPVIANMNNPNLIAFNAVVGGVGIAGNTERSSIEIGAVTPDSGIVGQQVDGSSE
jgi:hypothetical protein